MCGKNNTQLIQICLNKKKNQQKLYTCIFIIQCIYWQKALNYQWVWHIISVNANCENFRLCVRLVEELSVFPDENIAHIVLHIKFIRKKGLYQNNYTTALNITFRNLTLLYWLHLYSMSYRYNEFTVKYYKLCIHIL